MFLHAASLEFAHPVSGETLRIAAPLPDELERFRRATIATGAPH
jgi:23S rRNA pseudouridine955/2504/2580 synthase